MPDIGSSHRQTAGLPAVWSSIWSLIQGLGVVLSRTFRRPITVQYPEEQPYLPPRWRGRIVLTRDPDGEERCVACYLCAAACPVDCIALQATESPDQHDRRYPAWFRINFSRCIYCGHCEEACPTYAIQLIPDFEQGEYERRNMVYEKQDLLISGTGKYPDYNFYRVAGVRIGGKEKGEAENEQPPVDVRSLLP
jgi:NADH-quinone oxidoreductase subunit I